VGEIRNGGAGVEGQRLAIGGFILSQLGGGVMLRNVRRWDTTSWSARIKAVLLHTCSFVALTIIVAIIVVAAITWNH